MSATIIELQVENIKRLKAIQITPKGSTVKITGKNDQGKTSALDSIDYAFRGEKEICDEPIRQGQKSAEVFIKLSEEINNVCTIKRRFTPSGTVLEIRNADGVPQKSPQALLDAITSKLCFDPLNFIRLKPQEQSEQLRQLAGLDFTELNAARKTAYDERTIRNRELEAAKTKLLSYPFNAALPKEAVSITALATKLGEARSQNSRNAERRQAVTAQQNVAFDLSEDVRTLKEKLAQLERMVISTREQITAKETAFGTAVIETERMKSELTALQNADESFIQKEIDSIQKTNADIEANNRHLKAREDVDLLEGTIRGLTAKIQECDQDKAAQIEFANFPMPGLSFDEERGVLLNDVPFQQGSQARQLQAAVAIGLALNPKVRVILIRDGSLLDEDSMKLVSEMAEKNAAQIWVEIVNSKDPQAIVIENGEVV